MDEQTAMEKMHAEEVAYENSPEGRAEIYKWFFEQERIVVTMRDERIAHLEAALRTAVGRIKGCDEDDVYARHVAHEALKPPTSES